MDKNISTKQAIEVLNNTGVLAKDSREVELLTLFRKLPDQVKDTQIARMDGFIEAYRIKERTVV